ncbi:MAG: hypothetical protein COB36_12035 [Alphaproteobacteria bacterium]|nr:MAG: hypothetical protein COB36_12035 [Alphaproteobacteria bacterium]
MWNTKEQEVRCKEIAEEIRLFKRRHKKDVNSLGYKNGLKTLWDKQRPFLPNQLVKDKLNTDGMSSRQAAKVVFKSD